MADRIHYDSIGRKLHMEMNVDSLSDRDKITLLHHFLVTYDPGVGQPGYEAYQEACGVVLNQVNAHWG